MSYASGRVSWLRSKLQGRSRHELARAAVAALSDSQLSAIAGGAEIDLDWWPPPITSVLASKSDAELRELLAACEPSPEDGAELQRALAAERAWEKPPCPPPPPAAPTEAAGQEEKEVSQHPHWLRDLLDHGHFDEEFRP